MLIVSYIKFFPFPTLPCLFPFRQLHVMDETHVINQVKEDVCYVSQDFYRDMDIAKYV